MMSWLSEVLKPELKASAEKVVQEFAESDKFKELIHDTIIDILRDAPNDKPLTLVGFINKMAIAMFDAANGGMTYDQAKSMASATWREFAKDEGIKFGDDGYDWTGFGAITLARECSIEYW